MENMNQLTIVLALLIAFYSSCSARPVTAGNDDISGKWQNELGSNVTFEQEGQTLSGIYRTKVSRYPLKYAEFPLNGNIGTGLPTSLGFAVSFQGKKTTQASSAAWSGQYRIIDDEEIIYTTWTLTKAVKDKKDLWASTNVGQDVFKRIE